MSQTLLSRILNAGLLLGLTVSAAAQSTPMFTVTRLGGLGGSVIQPWSINENGDFVGYATTSTNSYPNAFQNVNGSFAGLGTLGGLYSKAGAINDAGTVVGWSFYESGSSNTHAFAYTAAGGMTDLGTLGGPTSDATDINEAGVIVGTSSTGTVPHAFRYSGGSMTDLGTLIGPSGVSYAYAINEAGVIAGRSNTNEVTDRAVLWLADNTIVDLGALPGSSGFSHAEGLNDRGWVVGNSTHVGSTSFTDRHAFVYVEGVMTDLGSLGGKSYATDVNNAGQVVGNSFLANGATNRPFFWDGGAMIDLTSVADFVGAGFNMISGIGEVWDINDAGQIVGWAITNTGGMEAFRLDPLTAPILLPETASAVPEPSSLASLAGLIGFGFAGLRRRGRVA